MHNIVVLILVRNNVTMRPLQDFVYTLAVFLPSAYVTDFVCCLLSKWSFLCF